MEDQVDTNVSTTDVKHKKAIIRFRHLTANKS